MTQQNSKFLKSLFALIISVATSLPNLAEEAAGPAELKSQDFETTGPTIPSVETPAPAPEPSLTLENTGTAPTVGPNQKLVSIKNEFYESIKVVLEAADAEIKNKEIYLNPYQVRNDVTISKNINYKIKLYDISDKYMGYIINTDTKSANLISISPFLLVQESNSKKPLPVIITVKPDNSSKLESTPIATVSTPTPKTIEPKEFKTNPNASYVAATATPVVEKQEAQTAPSGFKRIKISNISDADYHVDIVDHSGKNVGSGWDISNEAYLPEFLDQEYNNIYVRADYQLVLTNKKDKEVTTKPIKELKVDEKGNYVWFIGDDDQEQ